MKLLCWLFGHDRSVIGYAIKPLSLVMFDYASPIPGSDLVLKIACARCGEKSEEVLR